MSSAFKRTLLASLALVVTALGVGTLTASASAADAPARLWRECERGSGAGQCDFPWGIASDPQTGHLYVADVSDSRINELNAWGQFIKAWGWGVRDGSSVELQTCTTQTGCFTGLAGSGAGELSDPLGVATDSEGNVYVVDKDNRRVQKFDREGHFLLMFGGDVNKTEVQEGGTEAQRNLCTAASGNVCQAGTAGAGQGQFGSWPFGSFITVGPDDTVYVGDQNRIQKFGSQGGYKGEIVFPGETVAALAADPKTGQLYVRFLSASNVRKIGVGGEAVCATEDVFNASSIAADSIGRLYLIGRVKKGTLFFNRVQAFNPDCSASSEVALFGEDELSNISNLATGSVCSTSGGSVYLSNFDPTRSDGSFVSAYGPPPDKLALCPPAPEPPVIEAQFAASVEITEAVLKAKINPRFWANTVYYLEYGTQPCSEGGCEQKPLAPGVSLGAGTIGSGVTRSVPLDDLSPHTTYHYRFVATSHCVASEPEQECTAVGTDRSFVTFPSPGPPAVCPANQAFRYGPGALLPDCRGYEMVSPLDKQGADIAYGFRRPSSVKAVLEQSSASGEKLAYGTLRAFGDSDSAPYVPQYIASRDPLTGWASHSLEAPRTTAILFPTADDVLDTEFKAFSPDLCQAWLFRTSEPQLAPGAVPGYPNLYRRTDSECEEGGEAGYEAITLGEPLNRPAEVSYGVELQGLSGDGSAAIYSWGDNLSGASPAPAPQPSCSPASYTSCQSRLYEQRRGGPLEFLCVLPSGEPVHSACGAGTPNGGAGSYRTVSVQNAISADGSRVFWTASGFGDGPIYVRIEGTETVAVSKAAEEEAGSGGSQFWAASDDGTVAIFTSGGRLYEFSVDTKATTLLAKGVKGVAGVSEDATRTYFASTEAIAGSGQNSEGDEAQATKPNLYLREAGAGGGIRFIATLASVDVSPAEGTKNPYLVAPEPSKRATRVSADGTTLAFMSAGSPTAYDNLDAASGEPDTELYLYDAASNELLCASCNPSGSRPAGELDTYAGRTLWVGAKIPTWINTLYAPRVLSAGGERLFFESPDALVVRDTNGLTDIYQWEAPGTGTCTTSLYSYSEQDQGCVDLISSGKSARKAEFVDASPTGDDVFFTYQQSLVAQDTDGLVDIYDARALGGFPPPTPPPVICEGEACQGPAEAPEDPSPASSAYEGAGNVTEAAGRHPCRKGKVRRKGRCVAKRHRRSHHKRHAKPKRGAGK
jgi:sugar lactone lactonase YvrE